MTDPFLNAFASALADQTVSVLSAAGQAAVHKIGDFLRKRRDPETVAALETAQAQPETAPALVRRLERAAEKDPELAELLDSARTTIINELSGNVTNTISGDVGKAIQARDIHGSITFN
jgi:hypothetical protein